MWDQRHVSALNSSKEKVCELSLLLPPYFNILPVKMCFPFQHKTWFSLKTYLSNFCFLFCFTPNPQHSLDSDSSPASVSWKVSPRLVGSGAPLWGRPKQLLLRPARSQEVVQWDRSLKLDNLEAQTLCLRVWYFVMNLLSGRGLGPCMSRWKYQSNNR